MLSLLIYSGFFLSGFSALVYQVVWVRQFGNIFGNDIYSASIVIAVFMSGLGVGSFFAGRWADRHSRQDPRMPLRSYGYFELGIGGLGLGIAFLLPAAEVFSGSIASYRQMGNGWFALTAGSHLGLYGFAVVLLAPATLLMGGTLTLLIRFILGADLSQAGWKIGTLYGVNTLGAALGAFSVDFWLIPGLGLFNSQLVAVVLNIAVGAAVLGAAGRFGAARAAAAARGEQAQESDPAQSLRLVLPTATAIFLSGFAALGMEIIWFRVLTSIFGQYRAVFSLLLTVILIGIWLGSLLGGYLHKRFGRAAELYIASQAAFVVGVVAGLTVVDGELLRGLGDLFAGAAGQSGSYPTIALGMLLAVGAPALMMGFAYPLANANTQKVESVVGARSGVLYFANTIGAVLGSVAVGFYLLPEFGSKNSVGLMLLVAALAMVPLFLSTRRARKPVPRTALAAGIAASSLAIAAWHAQDDDFIILKGARIDDVAPKQMRDSILSKSEGILETILVVDARPGGRGKILMTNGHNMSGTGFLAQRYMRAFSHIPLLQLDRPSDALVICFGVGNTLHATTLHPSLERIEVVDLSEHVLKHNVFFTDTNFNAIADPRVEVFVNDGRQHLRMQPDGQYDLITLEPPPISFAGVSGLYSREFYQLARQKLKPGGYMTQWLPYLQTSREISFAMVRAFQDAFPNAVMLAGTFSDIILMGRNGAENTIDHRQFIDAMHGNPAVRADLERYEMGTITEVVGSFMAGPSGLRAKLSQVRAVTDDYPIMEYMPMYANQQSPPAEIIDVWQFGEWCTSCVADGRTVDGLDNLDIFLQVMDRVYETGTFGPDKALQVSMSINASKQDYDRAVAETPFLVNLTANKQR